ncbi:MULTISPECIES: winged helix-turn-helix transcriptional regulator [Olivibacter]|uniref:Transcriptional regulator, HxlR family n=2 Tax=Sphingobacteriaceae TaxID=84566 RepID=F4CCL0_SPHS2|nr:MULTISPECIES: helix-turn-helix domain-containing protein [Olivibacter]MCL4641048.1 helix-turn-helix transcriptional regulator [Olivibacter sp. UJ_SKK_5.1]MDM8177905.1 helix-turn-helix domain-containing protein [Olivibacter sp. 47]QEK99590.1 helix-turn-helix transcriptional regulator [Olivibacter sp. LS-1]
MSKRKPTSTNSINREKLIDFCGMMYAVDMLGGRWKLIILYKLEKKTLRFSELKKIIPGITDRMLTLHLQELERDGLVERTVYAEVPPRVDYRLTASAQALIPIWQQLEQWGVAHKQCREERDS